LTGGGIFPIIPQVTTPKALQILLLTVCMPAALEAGHHRHSHRGRRGKSYHHRSATRNPSSPASQAFSTPEPFGPQAREGFEASAGEEVISSIEVVEAQPSGVPVTGICRDTEIAEGDTAIPPEALRKSGAVNRMAAAVRKVGDLFRPKSSRARLTPDDVDVSDLLDMNLAIPVEGVDPQDLRDSFLESRRAGRRAHREHLALDIGAPRGTPVLATTDGEIVRAGREKRGGNAVYLRDASSKYLFYYCHLSKYAPGLKSGEKVKKGDVLGYVGATGNARGTHLHFSVTRLPDDNPDFRSGLAVNPYLIFLFAAKR
jgi:murein DD-endopeptidase MepM/ murein hydrolase activator NlpD